MRLSEAARERAGIWLLAALFAVAFTFGGSNRGDMIGQVYVRAAAILIGAAILLNLPRGALRETRALFLFVAAYLGVALLQLVPLPPAWWTALPMRGVFADTALSAGMAQPWRPISLVPEATVNSALACLPAFAALLCLARVRRRNWLAVVGMVVGFTLVSAVVGVLQVSTGRLYPYGVDASENAVGLLANRNHQAALLAAAVPAVAILAACGPATLSPFIRNAIAVVFTMLLVPLTLATGSRAGLVLMMVGIVGALALGFLAQRLPVAQPVSRSPRRRPKWASRAGLAVGAAAVLAAIACTIAMARAAAIYRLFAKDIEGDFRLQLFRPMMDIVSGAFPFGTGFGTFKDIFKVYEPAWYLGPQYFNHSHNDVVEIIIESGVFGILLISSFFIWWSIMTFRIWNDRSINKISLIARLGTIQTMIFMLAGLSDYPLRVPICQLIFATGCVFMTAGVGRGEARA